MYVEWSAAPSGWPHDFGGTTNANIGSIGGTSLGDIKSIGGVE